MAFIIGMVVGASIVAVVMNWRKVVGLFASIKGWFGGKDRG